MWWNRPDGTLVRDVAPYRVVMPQLSRGRNGAAVYFDLPVDVTATEAFVRAFNEEHPSTPVTLFHVVMWALTRTLHDRPHLNRFVAGGRLYEHDGIWISYSAKKIKVDGSPLVVVKRRFDPSEPFVDMVTAMHAQLVEARSVEPSSTDRELKLLVALPVSVRRAVVGLEHLADALGLLPGSFIRSDPMFASVFVANLGSLKMDAVFHHLYEYGSISTFCAVGRIHDEVVAGDGTTRHVAHLRFTYDERVEDGLYAHEALQELRALVEDPVTHGVVPDRSTTTSRALQHV